MRIIPMSEARPRHPKCGNLALGKKKPGGGVDKLDTWRLTSNSRTALSELAGFLGGTVTEIKDGNPHAFEVTLESDELIVYLIEEAIENGYRHWNQTLGFYDRICDGQTCEEISRNDQKERVSVEKPCVCLEKNLKKDARCKYSTQVNLLVLGTQTIQSFELDVSGDNARRELPVMVTMLRAMYGHMCAATLRLTTRRSRTEDGTTAVFVVPEIDECNVKLMNELLAKGAIPPGSNIAARFQALAPPPQRMVIEGNASSAIESGAPQLPAQTVAVDASTGEVIEPERVATPAAQKAPADPLDIEVKDLLTGLGLFSKEFKAQADQFKAKCAAAGKDWRVAAIEAAKSGAVDFAGFGRHIDPPAKSDEVTTVTVPEDEHDPFEGI